MKPIFQTTFGKKTGNCFSACVASILELSLEEIPSFCVYYSPSISAEKFDKWLSEKNLFTILVKFNKNNPPNKKYMGYHIIAGQSPRYNCTHAVVGYGDKILHDPHPDGDGLLNKNDWEYMFFIPKELK